MPHVNKKSIHQIYENNRLSNKKKHGLRIRQAGSYDGKIEVQKAGG
jgi:hypothetical protein